MIRQLTIRHISIWLVIYIDFYFFNSIICDWKYMFLFAFTFIMNFVLSYYFAYKYLILKVSKNGNTKTVLLFISSYLIFLGMEILNFKIIYPYFKIVTPRDHVAWSKFLQSDLKWYSQLFIVIFANYLSSVGIYKAEQYNQRKIGKLKMELEALKNQFHSHLNFNFLSFCYSKISKISAFTSEMVMCYINMLKHSLQSNQYPKVSIKNEIKYIEDFMQVQGRLNESIYHYFDYDIDNKEYKVKPMILGLIVEFVYRSGQLFNPDFPIEIQLSAINSELNFSIKFNKKNELNFNIWGHVNFIQIKKYIEINHKNNYLLQHNNVNENCDLNLKIILNGKY